MENYFYVGVTVLLNICTYVRHARSASSLVQWNISSPHSCVVLNKMFAYLAKYWIFWICSAFARILERLHNIY